jgi:hypothetical protein
MRSIAGPLIGEILNDLLEMVLDNPESNDHDTLISKAEQFLIDKRNSTNRQ